MVMKGEWIGGETNQEIGINISTLLIYKIDNHQKPTVQHMEFYSVFFNDL